MNSDQEIDEESKHLNVIKDVMNRGEIISHILNWKVSNQPSNAVGTEIRKIAHRMIHNIPNMYSVGGHVDIMIRWVMPDVTNSSYYYTDSIYSDRITKEHVKIMMQTLVRHVKENLQCAPLRGREDYHPNWGVSYLVTKPLEYGGGEVAAGDLS